MKITTVGWLSVLAMAVSSTAVWAFAAPDGAEPYARTRDSGRDWPVSQTSSESGASFSRQGALALEARLGHSVLLADQSNETYLFASVRAESGGGPVATAAPINLSIVIDRSGSMRGKRLDNALAAARGMLQRLRDGDRVSLVAYAEQAQVLATPTRIDDSSRRRLDDTIDRVSADGATCISCGIDSAVELLGQNQSSGARILLLSDGEATDGIRDVEGFRRLGESVRRAGIAVSSVGVDVDYNERIMSTIADASNGRHYFVEDTVQLAEVFNSELDSLARTLVSSADLEVELDRDVIVDRVFDREVTTDGNRLRIPLGSFALGEEKTLLVRLRVPAHSAGEHSIARVALRYQDSRGLGQDVLQGGLSLMLTRDRGAVAELDPFVLSRVQRSETASVLKDANRLVVAGKAAEARHAVRSSIEKLERDKAVALQAAPAAEAGAIASDFDRQRQALSAADERFAAPASGQPVEATRTGRAQVKKNEAEAFELSR